VWPHARQRAGAGGILLAANRVQAGSEPAPAEVTVGTLTVRWCSRMTLLLVLLLFGSLLPAPRASAGDPGTGTGTMATGWIVWVEPGTLGDPGLQQALAGLQARSIAPGGDQLVIEFHDARQAADRVARLLARAGIRYLEPEVRYFFQYEPNDELFAQQSWAATTRLPEAWDLTTGRDDLVVAVIDSGIYADHPDLAGKVLPGYDYLRRDPDPDDEVGHGTAVAGIIAAHADDAQGIAGAAGSVKLLPLKVGDASGASSATIAEAIYAAIEQGADVINLSLGADTPSATLEQAIAYAYEQRVVVVAAAGNKPDAVTFPASYARTISVGGAVADGTALAEFSSRITRVDLVAPAVNNLTTTWSDAGPGWGTVSGTSFSAPIVSGTVALMRSVQPELTVEQTRSLLTRTAQPLQPAGQPGTGAGLLDAGAAVRQALLPSLARTWQVADRPVSEGLAQRTWLWGPYAFAVRTEPYNESPQGTRLVAYYDKARMEVTEPEAPQDTSWYVTNGLLVRELITGQVQVGDTTFLPASPAQIPVAGDPNDTLGPTYASFARLLAVPPPEVETVIVQTIDRGGQVGADERLAGYGVLAGPLIPETNHRVASVFWEYLNSQGVLYQGGGYVTGALFDPAFYATGFPITEAYWTRAIVAGVVRDVLVQCFERRCLTYTPDNPEGWQVEMGNVGQHYYRWRYGEPPYEPSPEDPMAVALRLN